MFQYSPDKFHPVIKLPAEYELYDFTKGYDPNRSLNLPFGVGKYLEARTGMYTTDIFKQNGEFRNIHLGIDIGAPVLTEVYSFTDATVYDLKYHPAPGDYGNTIITVQELEGKTVYSLYGHLAAKSLTLVSKGEKIRKGALIGWVGDKHENGGWNPHLHFQLSLKEPTNCDMPGAATAAQLQEAVKIYPDPRLVLGPLY